MRSQGVVYLRTFMADRKFTQIAFSFDEMEHPVAIPPSEPAVPVPETAPNPVNVGVRIKALKEAVKPEAPPAIPEPPFPPAKQKSTRGRKSLKNADAEAALISIPEDEILFKKQYYSIGEVAAMFGVNTSQIRFWANEFEMVQPRKNRKGDRHFRPTDIKNLLLIHELLRRKKLTIEGAKEFLKNNKKAQEKLALVQSLRKIRSLFLEFKASL